jgi:predicted Fe-Mo cluster-binding NifX family protein
MKKTFAIPTENGVLCAHFGHCQQFAVIEVENNQIISTSNVIPPEHVPGLYPAWVAELGATDVIAGGMGQQAITLFNQQHINVFVGAPIDEPTILVKRFLEDKLELNANYCNHDESTHEHCSH